MIHIDQAPFLSLVLYILGEQGKDISLSEIAIWIDFIFSVGGVHWRNFVLFF